MTHPSYQTAMLMRGATTVRTILKNHLQTKLPPMIDVARTQWNLDEWMLPYPLEYKLSDPTGADKYPVVGAYVNETGEFVTVDYGDAMEDEYWLRYSCRLFVWVHTPRDAMNHMIGDRTTYYDNTIQCRDDMVACVRATLLSQQSCGSGGSFRIVAETIKEDYLDAVKTNEQNPGWLAGAAISVMGEHQEKIYRQPLGEVDSITLDVQPFPKET